MRTFLILQKGRSTEVPLEVDVAAKTDIVHVFFDRASGHLCEEGCPCDPEVMVKTDRHPVVLHNYFQ